MKLNERYNDLAVFEELLEAARMAAANDWEESFVRDMAKRYERFGGDTFMSDKQLRALVRIVEEK